MTGDAEVVEQRDAGAAPVREVVLTLSSAGSAALASERESRAAGIARAIREDLDDAEREIIRRLPEVLRKLRP